LQKFGDFLFWLLTLIAAAMFVGVVIWSGLACTPKTAPG
jgi:hypothetical protein